jgi:hypothetical protein
MGQTASRLPVTWETRVLSCEMCPGQSGTGAVLCRTQSPWDKFVTEKVAMGQVGAGHSGTGTGFSPTTSIVPRQDRYSNAPLIYICIFMLTLARRTSG